MRTDSLVFVHHPPFACFIEFTSVKWFHPPTYNCCLPESAQSYYQKGHIFRASRDSILIVLAVTLFTYLLGLAAVDLQSKILFVMFGVMLLALGPVIFIAHTMGHYAVSVVVCSSLVVKGNTASRKTV